MRLQCRHDPEQIHLLNISFLSTYYVWAHSRDKAGATLLGALMFGGDGSKPNRYMNGVAQETGFVPWGK